jgi:hypothetical protein
VPARTIAATSIILPRSTLYPCITLTPTSHRWASYPTASLRLPQPPLFSRPRPHPRPRLAILRDQPVRRIFFPVSSATCTTTSHLHGYGTKMTSFSSFRTEVQAAFSICCVCRGNIMVRAFLYLKCGKKNIADVCRSLFRVQNR